MHRSGRMGAEKDRFIALPNDAKIEFETVVYPHGPEYSDVGWRFPDGTVLVKTFSLEMETGNVASLRRLETRILQHRKMPGNDDEYGRLSFGTATPMSGMRIKRMPSCSQPKDLIAR